MIDGNTMKPLDPLQVALQGTNLIDASAGTGKTYTIETIYVRMLVELGLTVDQILVVTFTEAATKELSDRIRKRLTRGLEDIIRGKSTDTLFHHFLQTKPSQAKARIQKAISCFDEASIYTIHSFCQQMLRENAFESGVLFDMELVADQSPLFRDLAHDFFAAEVYDKPPIFARYLEEEAKLSVNHIGLFIQTIVSGQDLEIIPDAPRETDPVAPFVQAHAAARKIWQEDRADIVALLTKNKSLNGRVYSTKNVPTWSKAVDAYLAPGEPTRVCAAHQNGKDRIFRFAASTIAEKTKENAEPPRHRFFDACEDLIQGRILFDRQLVAFKHRLMRYVLRELGRRKEEQGVLSFDDLLNRLDRALQGDQGESLVKTVRGRYRAALVDEFQDTDRTQYRIFSRLYQDSEAPFFLIGDPKQSIYSFRGADIFSYLKAARQVKKNRFTLDVNWRSDPQLVHGINTLFKGSKNPFVIEEVAFEPVHARTGTRHLLRNEHGYLAPLQIRFIRRDGHPLTKKWANQTLPELVAEDIGQLLTSHTSIEYQHDGSTYQRPIRPSDIAVLTRTNRQLVDVQEALRDRHIPSVRTGAGSVFTTPAARELAELLHAVAEPGHGGKLRTALSTSFFGLSGNQIYETRENDRLWETWTGHFNHWHTLWNENGFIRMFHTVMAFEQGEDGLPCHGRILDRPGGERRITNLMHLRELLHEEALRKNLGIAGLLSWFELKRAEGSDSAEAAQLRLESDANAVQLVTIFKSKGLEYPIVYCPFLYETAVRDNKSRPVVFHDPLNQEPKLDIGSETFEQHKRIAAREKMAEDLRLTYVALTRAKCLCVTVWGMLHKDQQRTPSSLAYLLHNQGGQCDVQEMGKQMDTLTDDHLLDDLNLIAKGSDGAIQITVAKPETEKTSLRVDKEPELLACRRQTRAIETDRQVSSFSALTSKPIKQAPIEKEDRDHDAILPTPSELGTDAGVVNGERVTLSDFESGPLPGICIHEIYEELDFASENRDHLEELVVSKLRRYGFQSDTWQNAVRGGIEESLHTELDLRVPGLALKQITNAQRLNELEFTFPVANRPETRVRPLTGERLKNCFSKYGDRALLGTYLDRLGQLDFQPLTGFLKGFVDLIFEYDGRYYIVDYKTNHLGNSRADYGTEQLGQEMAKHHYFLQYHLYTVALHRYLAYRLKRYDYDRHFGAVYYLFVRGMSPNTGPDYGVFKDRPDKKLIEALSSLMEGGRAK